jgi:hypothetical protein
MKLNIKNNFVSLGLTCLLLVLLELLSATVLPLMGMKEISLAFNVLIVLFLAIRVDHSLMPFFILLIQVIHGFFSMEGWAIGTISGIIIATLVGILKDLAQFTSYWTTFFIVQSFLVLWYFLQAFLISLKIGHFDQFMAIFLTGFPECIILAFCSPIVFSWLKKIWHISSLSTEDSSHVW